MTLNHKTQQKKPRGYKETRFGSIPMDWNLVKLGELGNTYSGLSGKNKDDFGHGKPYIPYLNIFNNSRIDMTQFDYVNVGPEEKQNKVKYGDIFFTTSSETPEEVGMASVLLDSIDGLYLNSFCFGFRLHDFSFLIPEYARYCLRGNYIRKEIAVLAQGATRFNLSKTELLKLYIPLPPLKEQKKISFVLSSWDIAINKIQKLILGNRKFKKALMQQLLTGKRRFKGFRKSWRECHLSDIVKIVERPIEWDDDKLYRLASIRRWSGGMFVRNELYGHQIKVKKLRTIKEADFLISHIQSAYGSMALVPKEFGGMYISELYTVLLPKNPDEFDIRYLAYMSQDKYMWHLAYLASNGFFAERLRLNFNPEDFLKHKINIPADIKEQQQIITTLDLVNSEIDLLVQQLDLLKQQKRGLMQKLLTGQIRVKV